MTGRTVERREASSAFDRAKEYIYVALALVGFCITYVNDKSDEVIDIVSRIESRVGSVEQAQKDLLVTQNINARQIATLTHSNNQNKQDIVDLYALVYDMKEEEGAINTRQALTTQEISFQVDRFEKKFRSLTILYPTHPIVEK